MNKKEIEKDISYLFNLESSLSKEDKEHLLSLLSPERNKFLFNLKNNKINDNEIKEVLKKNKGYCDNYEVMLECVKINGFFLGCASKRLKNNYDIVLEAIENSGHALYYASKKLKDNETIVLSAIKKDWYYLNYASNRLQEKLYK